MDAVVTIEYAESRAMTLSPEEFGLLCKSVLSEPPPSARFSVTAFRQDGGIDIDGRIRNSLLDVSPSVQAEQYDSGNTVSSPEIQRFQEALIDTGCDIGTVITVSSFTTSAVKSAERTGIYLVNSSELFNSMIDLHVGVCRQSIRLELDEEFWSLFGGPGEVGMVPSKRIPFANSFEVPDTVFSIIGDTRGEKDDIIKPAGTSPRHADLYAIAGWVPGFVRQERPDKESHRQRHQSFARSGVRYVAHRATDLDDEAEILLLDGIRDAEIVERPVDSLSESGSLGRSDLIDFIISESELSWSSAKHWDSSVGTWLVQLPEVLTKNGREKRYI